MLNDAGEPDELVLAHELHHEPAVGGAEGVDDRTAVAVQCVDAHREVVHDDVGHGHGGVVHRDVDVLPLAGGVAVPQRRECADDREQRRADVTERADGVGAAGPRSRGA